MSLVLLNKEINIYTYQSFPRYLVPLFQNESSFEFFHLPVGLISMEMNLGGGVLFYSNGLARRTDLTRRQKAPRKWVFPHMETILLFSRHCYDHRCLRRAVCMLINVSSIYTKYMFIMQQYLRNPAL